MDNYVFSILYYLIVNLKILMKQCTTLTGAKRESVRVLRAANGRPYGENDPFMSPCCLSQSIKGEKGTTSFTASVGVITASLLSMSISS